MSYCVYLVSYTGSKLPPFYVGSSSVEKVNSGYMGSISSKKYKHHFRKERITNPELFSIEILSMHNTRKAALAAEHEYQVKHSVVKSELYMNEACASPDGYFGRDVSGELNPFYGRTHSPETLEKMRKPKTTTSKMKKPKSEEHRAKIAASARDNAILGADKIRLSKLGKKRIYRLDGSYFYG